MMRGGSFRNGKQSLWVLWQNSKMGIHSKVKTTRLPRDQEIVESLSYKPKILDRKTILERVGEKIIEFVNTYVEGMGGSV